MNVANGYFLFDSFKKYDCTAAFSTGRIHLGFDNNPNLKKNRTLFLKPLGINSRRLVCCRQVHGNRVFIAAEKDKGRGALDNSSALSGYDGIITQQAHLPLAVFTADCLSVFLFDVKNRVAAILHAGWGGTRDNVVLSALNILKDKFSSRPKDILCGLGPCIRSCCYGVGPEFGEHFSYGLAKRKGRFFFDLVGANLRQMLGGGILKRNITDTKICTSCRNKDLFSYRKEARNAGRMMSVIMIEQ
jgi:YfiH family protein